jgi:phthalate 4,5-cis-dihydrodiol dehydrogenase
VTDLGQQRRLRIGVVGLGRAFVLMAPTFLADARCRLVAAADPRAEARERFEADFQGRAYETLEALLADPAVEAVYIATPHHLHAAQAVASARAGKHLLVEKPMALTLSDCAAMAEAAREAGVALVVGPSHSFDAPIAMAAEIVASGEFGAARMVSALNYTDFLYRPRRPEELDTARGGGVVFSQAAHQIDVVRRLVGRPIERVRAQTGRWDAARPTEGAYSAWLGFEGGAAASLTYSGYGRFDTDEFQDWVGELGAPRTAGDYGRARRGLARSQDAEAAQKDARGYGPTRLPEGAARRLHEHFGFVLVSCEHADLRPTPRGVLIYGDEAVSERPAPPATVPRQGVIDELYAAVVQGVEPLHSADWGADNLAACLALLDSSAQGREIVLERGDRR